MIIPNILSSTAPTNMGFEHCSVVFETAIYPIFLGVQFQLYLNI